GGSRGATGFLQQHEGKQPRYFRLWPEFGRMKFVRMTLVRMKPGQMKVSQQPAQSNRLAGQLGPRYLRTRRSRVALVKDEIDDLKHRAQPLRQFLRHRHLVGNACLPNLCLGAHNALRQRLRSNEEGLRY